MSKSLRLIALAVLCVACQLNLTEYMRIAGVAPDLMIVTLSVITTYCGSYGGFCLGSVIALLYDASVGYVLAVNMIGYPAIGYFAPMMRARLDKVIKKFLKHKSVLTMMIVCLVFSLAREFLYMGYLFLIGSQQTLMILLRALLCACYNSVLVIPGVLLVRPFMTWHPRLRNKQDLIDD